MKKLLKSIFVLTTSQAAVAVVSVIRNKLLALLLGPEGIGLFAQLQSLQNLLANGVPMGMQLGALKYMSANRANDKRRLLSTISTSAKAFALLSALTTVVCLILAKPISAWSVGNANMYLYVMTAILGVPFMIQTQLWQNYLRAGLEMKEYSATMVITSLIGLPIVVPLVLLWKQAGAAAHLLIIAIVGYIVAKLYTNRSMGSELNRRVESASFDKKLLINLMRFAAGNFPVFAIDLVVPFIIRVQIIRDMGLDANGIYQAAFAISSQYLVMPLNAIGIYVFPKISQMADLKQINKEINDALKISLLFCTSGILVVLLFRDVFTSLLFSKKFLLAASLMSWQSIGDFLKSITMVLQYPMLPLERFRARVVINLLRNTLFMIVFYLPKTNMRLEGAVWAYAASWLFEFIAIYLYTHHTNGFTFTGRNKFLLLTSTSAVAWLAFSNVTDPRWRLIGACILGLWTATSLNMEDLHKIRETVISKIKGAVNPDD
ncbi:MAG: oligosaccharide flippase family protein [Armatimonadota bacterium]